MFATWYVTSLNYWYYLWWFTIIFGEVPLWIWCASAVFRVDRIHIYFPFCQNLFMRMKICISNSEMQNALCSERILSDTKILKPFWWQLTLSGGAFTLETWEHIEVVFTTRNYQFLQIFSNMHKTLKNLWNISTGLMCQEIPFTVNGCMFFSFQFSIVACIKS